MWSLGPRYLLCGTLPTVLVALRKFSEVARKSALSELILFSGSIEQMCFRWKFGGICCFVFKLRLTMRVGFYFRFNVLFPVFDERINLNFQGGWQSGARYLGRNWLVFRWKSCPRSLLVILEIGLSCFSRSLNTVSVDLILEWFLLWSHL